YDDERLEFSNLYWFSMMFSACIGLGRLTFAIAEPIYHFQNNFNEILCEVAGNWAEAMRSADV
ncbi:MAG: BCCT family transporter, partial [Paracoccaceae bacterium]